MLLIHRGVIVLLDDGELLLLMLLLVWIITIEWGSRCGRSCNVEGQGRRRPSNERRKRFLGATRLLLIRMRLLHLKAARER